MTKAEFHSFLSVMIEEEQKAYIYDVCKYNNDIDFKKLIEGYDFNIFVCRHLIGFLFLWESSNKPFSYWANISIRYDQILSKP